MHAGPAAAARHEVGPRIGDFAAAGLERPLGVGIRDAIAARLRPGRQVEPGMPCPEEELDQQTAQRVQVPQQDLLKVEEGRGARALEAVGDDLVESLVDLRAQGFEVRWTRRGG